MFAFLDFSPSEPGPADDDSIPSGRHADLSSLALGGADAGTDPLGAAEDGVPHMDLSSWYDMLHSEDLALPMLGAEAEGNATNAQELGLYDTELEVTDFEEGMDTLVIEFPAENDPGSLSVKEGDNGISAVVLGGVVVAMVRSDRPVNLDSIVLKGV